MSENKYEVEYQKRFIDIVRNGLPDELLEEYLQNAPEFQRKFYRQALVGEKALRSLRIRMKCLECSGWQKHESGLCRVYECPLWKIRPYQGYIGQHFPETQL